MDKPTTQSRRILQAFFLTRQGDNTVAGHLLPESDDTYDLGTIERKWRFGYFDDVYARTLTVEQIRGISIRANLLRNGGFEQVNRDQRNQPLGWESSEEVHLGEAVRSILDDEDYPVHIVDDPATLSLGLL